MVCEPRHSVDSRLMMVETDEDEDDLPVSAGGALLLPPGVPDPDKNI